MRVFCASKPSMAAVMISGVSLAGMRNLPSYRDCFYHLATVLVSHYRCKGEGELRLSRRLRLQSGSAPENNPPVGTTGTSLIPIAYGRNENFATVGRTSRSKSL